MAKTIIMIHGRAPKPAQTVLKKLWVDALRWGLERDHSAKLARFDKATLDFVYYGDESNRFLDPQGYDPAADGRSRRVTLDVLKEYSQDELVSRDIYDHLEGKTALKETLADLFGGFLSAVRLSDKLIEKVAPDLREYWNFESDFASRVRYPMIGPMVKAMERKDDILVVAHSLGTMIAYDTLWKFSRMGEYRPRYSDRKIDLFISLGSPLADETVKRHVKGSNADGERCYPANIERWENVAAEDDYIAHDQKVADDYRPMLDMGLVKSIEDHRIYNLSVRDIGSNPHHSGGYLVHPVVAKLVADWL